MAASAPTPRTPGSDHDPALTGPSDWSGARSGVGAAAAWGSKRALLSEPRAQELPLHIQRAGSTAEDLDLDTIHSVVESGQLLVDRPQVLQCLQPGYFRFGHSRNYPQTSVAPYSGQNSSGSAMILLGS